MSVRTTISVGLICLVTTWQLSTAEELQEQRERMVWSFGLLSKDLESAGHVRHPKSGPNILGASMYVQIDEVAFGELYEKDIVTDILIDGRFDKKDAN